MPDLLQAAIEDAARGDKGAELNRKAKRLNALREDPAWQELREVVKERQKRAAEILGKKALAGVDAQALRDEANYCRGFLDGMVTLLDMPEDVHKNIEARINASLERLKNEAVETAVSPYT